MHSVFSSFGVSRTPVRLALWNHLRRLRLNRFLIQGMPLQYPLARQMVIGKPQVGQLGQLGYGLHMVCIWSVYGLHINVSG